MLCNKIKLIIKRNESEWLIPLGQPKTVNSLRGMKKYNIKKGYYVGLIILNLHTQVPKTLQEHKTTKNNDNSNDNNNDRETGTYIQRRRVLSEQVKKIRSGRKRSQITLDKIRWTLLVRRSLKMNFLVVSVCRCGVPVPKSGTKRSNIESSCRCNLKDICNLVFSSKKKLCSQISTEIDWTNRFFQAHGGRRIASCDINGGTRTLETARKFLHRKNEKGVAPKNMSGRSFLVDLVEKTLSHYTVTHDNPNRSVFCIPAGCRHGDLFVALDIRSDILAVYVYCPPSLLDFGSRQEVPNHEGGIPNNGDTVPPRRRPVHQRLRDHLIEWNASILIGNMEITKSGYLRFRHSMHFRGWDCPAATATTTTTTNVSAPMVPPPTASCINNMIDVAVNGLERFLDSILRSSQGRNGDIHNNESSPDNVNNVMTNCTADRVEPARNVCNVKGRRIGNQSAIPRTRRRSGDEVHPQQGNDIACTTVLHSMNSFAREHNPTRTDAFETNPGSVTSSVHNPAVLHGRDDSRATLRHLSEEHGGRMLSDGPSHHSSNWKHRAQ